MKLSDRAEICLRCVHFRNQPAYLEANIQGLTTLGSAYGSVRKDDGICAKHDLYLSAYDWCRAPPPRLATPNPLFPATGN